MNKFLSLLVILVCSNLAVVFGQSTTIEVDNQYPGWLSSKIPFKDQESVKNLTVTGYLNGTDIKFIRELLGDRQLTHLDLSDANIVAGGDASCTTRDNEVPNFKPLSSSVKKGLDFLSLPKSIEKVSGRIYDGFDTLIIGGKFKILEPYWVENINCLLLREGIDSLAASSFGSDHGSITARIIKLPSTIKYLSECIFENDTVTVNIENIDYFENRCVRNFDLSNGAGVIDNDTIVLSANLSGWNANAFNLKRGVVVFLNDKLEWINLSYEDSRGNIKYSGGALFTENMVIHAPSRIPVKIRYYERVRSLLKTAIVYVPKGCAALYMKTEPWSNATIIEEKVPVAGVKLDQDNISFSEINSSVQLTATVLPEDADNQKVLWKSSNIDVAAVANGIVTCKGYGTAVITATTEDGGFAATCNVTATKKEVLPSAITLDKTDVTVKVGETLKLKADVLPDDADDKGVVWYSYDNNIASVSSDGVVTGVKAGTTTVFAATHANNIKAGCDITVLQPATGVTIDQTNISFANIGESIQLSASVLPEDASNKKVVWESSDTKVAIVSNGKTVCTGFGTAVISVVTEDGGFMATCMINATSGINGVSENEVLKDAKRYDVMGRELSNPVDGLNILKTKDGRVVKTTVNK